MKRNPLLLCLVAFVTVASGIGIAVSKEGNRPAKDDPFIVHEWGTFTTFSGSDGVFLDFRPLAQDHSDLPDFVLDRSSKSPLSVFTKSRIRGKVRMETPVTYFYTDRIREVDVSVDFPQGLLTEFYPPVQSIAPKFDPKAAYDQGERIGNSSLDWGRVTLIPTNLLVPGLDNESLQNQISNHIAQQIPIRAANDYHYAQARQTDSALVHVSVPMNGFGDGENAPSISHMEKFLFYRGVGKFELPFHAVYQDDGSVNMQNEATFPLSSAILIDVQGETIQTASLNQIEAGKAKPFSEIRTVSTNELSNIVVQALEAEGLYSKEARSMVETWKQSWFTEQGTRVLYMVPPPITDELLPLHIKPAPQETLRVLVGRMEMMTPEAETQLTRIVAESARKRSELIASNKERAEDQQQNYVMPPSITEFGRMAEPALARVAALAGDPQLRQEALQLMMEIRQASGG